MQTQFTIEHFSGQTQLNSDQIISWLTSYEGNRKTTELGNCSLSSSSRARSSLRRVVDHKLELALFLRNGHSAVGDAETELDGQIAIC